MSIKKTQNHSINLAPRLRRRLSARTQGLLAAAGRQADSMGLQVYAVGGFVRDLLLRRRNEDVDLAVEGPGIAYARHLAREWGVGVQTHERFGTATLRLDGGGKLDVATARQETYPHPAALPQVAAAGIEQDLRRRDFTINAMAVRLNPGAFGRLVDPLSGRQDLEAGMIRILHRRSFEDDPTRIFRAVRFEQRFGFRLEPVTRRCLQEALRLNYTGRLSRPRVLRELFLLLDEAQPVLGLRRLARLGVLGRIHRLLSTRRFGPALETLAFAERKLSRPVNRRHVLFLALLDALPWAAAEAWVREYQVPRGLKAVLRLQKQKGEAARARFASGLAGFEGWPDEAVLFELAKAGRTPALANRLKTWLIERGSKSAGEHA